MSNEASAFVLPHDRHKGKTLGEVLVLDRSYVEWLARQMVPRTEQGKTIQAMARAVLESPAASAAVPAAAGVNVPATAGNGNAENGTTKAASAPARSPCADSRLPKRSSSTDFSRCQSVLSGSSLNVASTITRA